MAKRSKKTSPDESVDFVDFDENITEVDVTDEVARSFTIYALSTLTSRAIPDVRDGLKPVQRRILWTMHEMGLRPGVSHAKSARVTGEVMGKYHPHGDLAIYEALVRMGQDFSLRIPLIDKHGNFGGLDDPPAAARYTEARASHAGAAMVAGIGENTVDFVPNYDGHYKQPAVLPSAFPNLLVNGAMGIAVGMQTMIPTHNLGEVSNAILHLIANPGASLADMMRFVKGPDFPGGARVIGTEAIKEMYLTGRGRMVVQAKAAVEEGMGKRARVIFTELPYMIGPEQVIAKVREHIQNKTLEGVHSIQDATDNSHGMRLVVEVKAGVDPRKLLRRLYKLTPLESTFAGNIVALVDQQPRQLNLLECLQHYVDHRLEVITRRTQFRLDKATREAHILAGLEIALANIDEVVAIIRASKDTDVARTKLMKSFKLDEEQCNHILEMPLRRLTSLEVSKIKEQLKELRKAIKEYQAILASEKMRREIVATELTEVTKKLDSPRRTEIVTKVESAPAEEDHEDLTVEDTPQVVRLTTAGRLTRRDPGAKHKAVALSEVSTGLAQRIVAITSEGRLVEARVADLPEYKAPTKGLSPSEAFDLVKGETVVTLLSQEQIKKTPGFGLLLVTREGAIKRLIADEVAKVKPGQICITLKENDHLVGVHVTSDDQMPTTQLVMVSSDAQALRMEIADVAPKGKAAGPMAGMKLMDGAYIVSSGLVQGSPESGESEGLLVSVSDAGAAKSSSVSEIPIKGRGGKGVRIQRFRKNESAISVAYVGPSPVSAADANAKPVAYPTSLEKRDAPGAPLTDVIESFGQL